MAMSMVCQKEFTSLDIYLKMNFLMRAFWQGKRRFFKKVICIFNIDMAAVGYRVFSQLYIPFPQIPIPFD